MRYNFTDRVRRALAEARDVAAEHGDARVAPEHLLMGLLREGGGLAMVVLERLGADGRGLGERLEVELRGDRGAARQGGELPYTGEAKRALERAMAEAKRLNHEYVGTEHLFLGILALGRTVPGVLREAGVTLEAARAAVVEVLGDGSGTAAERSAAPARGAEAGFRIAIDDSSSASIYEQIVAQVQEAVATKRLSPGDRLPTVRRLADDLDIAPGTVARAYGELERARSGGHGGRAGDARGGRARRRPGRGAGRGAGGAAAPRRRGGVPSRGEGRRPAARAGAGHEGDLRRAVTTSASVPRAGRGAPA